MRVSALRDVRWRRALALDGLKDGTFRIDEVGSFKCR